MFVSRSGHQEGKRSLEIYSDPRFPIFYIITGSPDAIDKFVGTTVANFAEGKDAQAALRQPGSTLKIIVGGIEYWPLGSGSALTLQDLYYYGPNGETLSQKVWGAKIQGYGGQMGVIGPFVESNTDSVQCALFYNGKDYADILKNLRDNPNYYGVFPSNIIAAAIQYFHYDPDKRNIVGTKDFDSALVRPLLTSELFDSE
jgi:hypothetical protein